MKTLHRSGDYLSSPARLLEIDARLRSGKKPSHGTLAKELGVSTRTIQRDFDYLCDTIGAPLEYDARAKGWFYSEETFFLPSVLATADDLLALLLLRQAIEQYAGTPYAAAARKAFRLIEQALPAKERLAAEWVQTKVAFTDFPPAEIGKEVWQAVLEGLRTARSVNIQYAKPGARPRPRRVDPLGLIVSEGDWYLYTHDHQRNARRTFLLARIRKAEVTEATFAPPTDFDLATYVREGFGGLQADGEAPASVRITFTKEASALAAERRWHAAQRMRFDSHQRLVIDFIVREPSKAQREIARHQSWISRIEWDAAPDPGTALFDETEDDHGA